MKHTQGGGKVHLRRYKLYGNIWEIGSSYRSVGSTFKPPYWCLQQTFEWGDAIRVSSERTVSRKNAKIFGRISQKKISQKYFREMRKFCENAKCENFVKTRNVLAATINCSKELVEFSALIPQYLFSRSFIMSY